MDSCFATMLLIKRHRVCGDIDILTFLSLVYFRRFRNNVKYTNLTHLRLRMFLCSSSSAVGLWLNRLVRNMQPWSAYNHRQEVSKSTQSIRGKELKLPMWNNLLFNNHLIINFERKSVGTFHSFFFSDTHSARSEKKLLVVFSSPHLTQSSLPCFDSNSQQGYLIDILTHSVRTFTTDNPGL